MEAVLLARGCLQGSANGHHEARKLRMVGQESALEKFLILKLQKGNWRVGATEE